MKKLVIFGSKPWINNIFYFFIRLESDLTINIHSDGFLRLGLSSPVTIRCRNLFCLHFSSDCLPTKQTSFNSYNTLTCFWIISMFKILYLLQFSSFQQQISLYRGKKLKINGADSNPLMFFWSYVDRYPRSIIKKCNYPVSIYWKYFKKS